MHVVAFSPRGARKASFLVDAYSGPRTLSPLRHPAVTCGLSLFPSFYNWFIGLYHTYNMLIKVKVCRQNCPDFANEEAHTRSSKTLTGKEVRTAIV